MIKRPSRRFPSESTLVGFQEIIYRLQHGPTDWHIGESGMDAHNLGISIDKPLFLQWNLWMVPSEISWDTGMSIFPLIYGRFINVIDVIDVIYLLVEGAKEGGSPPISSRYHNHTEIHISFDNTWVSKEGLFFSMFLSLHSLSSPSSSSSPSP